MYRNSDITTHTHTHTHTYTRARARICNIEFLLKDCMRTWYFFSCKLIYSIYFLYTLCMRVIMNDSERKYSIFVMESQIRDEVILLVLEKKDIDKMIMPYGGITLTWIDLSIPHIARNNCLKISANCFKSKHERFIIHAITFCNANGCNKSFLSICIKCMRGERRYGWISLRIVIHVMHWFIRCHVS